MRAQRLAQQCGARVVEPEEIYDVPCEIYAPCALGGTLNDHTIPRLQCRIVAGSANNQCLREEHGDVLGRRGIVYAPDFVINAGGLLNVAMELAPAGYDEACVLEKVHHIATTLRTIFETAKGQDISTSRAALSLAKHQLEAARQAAAHGRAERPAQAEASRGQGPRREQQRTRHTAA